MADRSDFENVAMAHLDAVYRAAFALCGRAVEAEDLAQETLAKAFERFESFRPGTNCKAWLLRILRNTWIDELRHRKIVGPQVPVDEAVLAEPEHIAEAVWTNAEDVLENFSDEDVIRALKQLPGDQRLTLFLVDVEQLSQEEVAEIMDVAVGTVKSRSCRARTLLRKKLLVHARDLGFTEREP